ncbi:MAG: pyridoxal-phosphate dependent enzyme [Polyangiales bacterium]|nr:pyridoxal-phosphate dependent enzyme [Myxococcales bacterium]MCB9660273.1 pyridoxal-phosphate dependent enzyme [Sandaracinaceae bacterium]
MTLPQPDDVLDARQRIHKYVRETPVFTSASLDALCGATLFFKAENLQRAGAFKFRGATNAVLQLDEHARARGVATHSSGNHGAALSLAAQRAGLSATVVMPNNSVSSKRAAVLAFGGRVVDCEPTAAARVAGLDEVLRATGATSIHPYEHPAVVAGQGTAALELMEQAEGLNALLVPVGGGGLLGGSLLAVRASGLAVDVFACEPAGAADAARSFRARERLVDFVPDTVADGLRTPLGEVGFALMMAHASDVVAVSEHAILLAMRLVWERLKLVVEPSSAVPLAALLPGGPLHDKLRGKRVGLILSGGNVDLDALPALPPLSSCGSTP